MSTFNAEQFLQTRVQGSNDTKLPVIPQGEYLAMVEKVNAREQEIKKGERAGSTIVVADIIWELLDDRLKEALNMQKITCKQSLFLDLTPEKQLDMGKSKNIALGKVREALGLNDKKKDFFLGLLIGNTAKVQVVHEPNEQDPNSPYSKVNRVAPMNS